MNEHTQVTLSVVDVAVGKVIERLESDGVNATLKLKGGSQLAFTVSGRECPCLDVTVRGAVEVDASDLSRDGKGITTVSAADLINGTTVVGFEMDDDAATSAVVNLSNGAQIAFQLRGGYNAAFGVRARGFVELQMGDAEFED